MKPKGLRALLERAGEPLVIIGLMSGTSADGIDAAAIEIGKSHDNFQWRLLGFECIAWEPELRSAILDVCKGEASLPLLTALNGRIGEAFGAAALRVVLSSGLDMNDVDAIASHGQTVWHQPALYAVGEGGGRGTLQLGEASIIAARTGCVVISDFRAADMALGGQGAPLVPFVDYALFSHPSENRIVLNLGGIANLTYLPAGATIEKVIAFDTGPANMILDALFARMTAGQETFDSDGALAAQGVVSTSLLRRLLLHPYFQKAPPKSTGREEFGEAFAERILLMGVDAGLSHSDILATVTALTATSLGDAIQKWILPLSDIDTVIMGGGGTHNSLLVKMLTQRLSPARLTTHAEFGLPDDAKEAVAFAFLARETLNGLASNVPSATGAKGGAILGKISLPPCA